MAVAHRIVSGAALLVAAAAAGLEVQLLFLHTAPHPGLAPVASAPVTPPPFVMLQDQRPVTIIYNHLEKKC